MKKPIDEKLDNQELNHTIEEFKIDPSNDIGYFKPIIIVQKQCPICLRKIEENSFFSFSKCGHMFCNSCLEYHITMRIRERKIVGCLEYKCEEILFGNSDHIKSLTKQLRDKYFQIILQYKNCELIKCKFEKCSGLIFTKSFKVQKGKKVLTCTQCPNTFCQKCKNQVTICNCEQNSYIFQNLKNNYNYIRCPKCGHAIEKVKGCYHLTCICRYQFCELCSLEWSHGHLCQKNKRSSNQLINYIPPNNPQNSEEGRPNSIILLCKYILNVPAYILISLQVIIEFFVKFSTVILYLPFFFLAGGVIGYKSWRKKGTKCLIIIFLALMFPIAFPVAMVYSIFTDTNEAQQWRSCFSAMLKVQSTALYRKYNVQCLNDRQVLII